MSKKLYRSKKDRIILGVCGGIAEYFEVDSTIVRIITALLLLSGASSIVIIYLLLGVIIPENPKQKTPKRINSKRNNYLIGAGLLIIGLTLLLDSYNILSWSRIWPTVLIIIGVFVIWQEERRKK